MSLFGPISNLIDFCNNPNYNNINTKLENEGIKLSKEDLDFDSLKKQPNKYDVLITKQNCSNDGSIYKFSPVLSNEEMKKGQVFIYFHGAISIHSSIENFLNSSFNNSQIKDWGIHPKLIGALVSKIGHPCYVFRSPGFGVPQSETLLLEPRSWLPEMLETLSLSYSTEVNILAVSSGNITFSQANKYNLLSGLNIKKIYYISSPLSLIPYIGIGEILNLSSNTSSNNIFNFIESYCSSLITINELSFQEALIRTFYIVLLIFPHITSLNNSLKLWVRLLLDVPGIAFDNCVLTILISIGYIPNIVNNFNNLNLNNVFYNIEIDYNYILDLITYYHPKQKNIKYILAHEPDDSVVPFVEVNYEGVVVPNIEENKYISKNVIYNIEYYIKDQEPTITNQNIVGIYKNIDTAIIEDFQITNYVNHQLTTLLVLESLIDTI